MTPQHEPEVLAARERRRVMLAGQTVATPPGYVSIGDLSANVRQAVCADLLAAEADYKRDPTQENCNRVYALRKRLAEIQEWP